MWFVRGEFELSRRYGDWELPFFWDELLSFGLTLLYLIGLPIEEHAISKFLDLIRVFLSNTSPIYSSFFFFWYGDDLLGESGSWDPSWISLLLSLYAFYYFSFFIPFLLSEESAICMYPFFIWANRYLLIDFFKNNSWRTLSSKAKDLSKRRKSSRVTKYALAF